MFLLRLHRTITRITSPESSRFTGAPRPAAVLLPAACFMPVGISVIPMVMTTMPDTSGLKIFFRRPIKFPSTASKRPPIKLAPRQAPMPYWEVMATTVDKNALLVPMTMGRRDPTAFMPLTCSRVATPATSRAHWIRNVPSSLFNPTMLITSSGTVTFPANMARIC